jgi:hypothetical protein
MATLDEINKAYATVLGRGADKDGENYFANSGNSYDQIVKIMQESPEYKNSHQSQPAPVAAPVAASATPMVIDKNQALDMINRSAITGVPTSEFDAAGGYDAVYALAQQAGWNGTLSKDAIAKYGAKVAETGVGNWAYSPPPTKQSIDNMVSNGIGLDSIYDIVNGFKNGTLGSAYANATQQPVQQQVQQQVQQPQQVSSNNNYNANETRVAEIVDRSNPLVQQAMARARQSFASRGLLNSSMAEEAAQEAAISKALDIAAPDTSAYYTDARDAKQFDYNKALAELGYAQQEKMARLNNDLSLSNAQSQYNMKVGDTTHTNYLTMIDRIQSDATKQVQQINASAMPYDEKVKAIDSIQAQSQASIANSNELFKTMNGWQNEWAVAANSYNWNVPSPDPKPVSNPPISSDNSPSS